MAIDFDLNKVDRYISNYSVWYNEIQTHFSKIEQAYEKALENVEKVISGIIEDVNLADEEILKCNEQIYQNKRELEEQKNAIQSCRYAIEIYAEKRAKRDQIYAEGGKSSDYEDYNTKIAIQENQIKTHLKRIEAHATNIAGLDKVKTCIENDITKLKSCQSKLEIQKSQIENVLRSLREVGNCLTKISDLKQYLLNNVYPVMKKISILQSEDGSRLSETKIDNVEIFKKIKKQLEKTFENLNQNTNKIDKSAKYLSGIISDSRIEQSNNSVKNISNILNSISNNLEERCKKIGELESAVNEYINFANKNF